MELSASHRQLSQRLAKLSWIVGLGKEPSTFALSRIGAVRMIENAGFEVIEAANADEALQILESRSNIRVVLTDIHMPGSIDGLKLAHAVRHRWPPLHLPHEDGRCFCHFLPHS